MSRRHVLGALALGVAVPLAGCATGSETDGTPRPETTVTITLENRDDAERSYEVVVEHGPNLTDSFSGTLPPGERIEMVATGRVTDGQHEVTISTDGGQRGRTWDPTDCRQLLVEAFVEGGEPGFESRCGGE